MLEKALMIAAFTIVVIGIGLYCRRHAASVDGFILGGRSVGPWLSAFAYGTSYFSAVIFVGYAGQFGWRFGVSAVWIGIANAVIGSLLAWWVLGPRTREMTHRLGASTMPEFFGARFGSPALRIVSAAIVFVFLVPYTASVYNGLSRLFTMAFGVPYEVCIIGMAVVTCVYVVLGGYMATVLNDFVQGIVMLVGIVAVVAAVLGEHGGFAASIVQLSQVPTESPIQGALVSFFGPDAATLLAVMVLTSLGTWGLPQMVQKFYAIRTGPAVKQGAIISTLFALVVAGGSYFMGAFGRLFSEGVAFGPTGAPVYDSIVPAMLQNLPDLLIGLVVVLVLSASMSTLSSLVLTGASTITLDVVKARLRPDLGERGQITWIRGLIAFFVALSAALALYQYNSSVTFIAQLMGISWGALAGSFLGPFVWGLFWGRVSRASVWASFACGVGLTSANMVAGAFGSPIVAGALAIVLSLVVVPLVSLVTPAYPFEVAPPHGEGAIDREYVRALEGEGAGEDAPAREGGRE